MRSKPTQIRPGLPTSTATTTGQATSLSCVDHGSGPSLVSLLLSSPDCVPNYRSEHVAHPFQILQCSHCSGLTRSPARPHLLLFCPLLATTGPTGFFSASRTCQAHWPLPSWGLCHGEMDKCPGRTSTRVRMWQVTLTAGGGGWTKGP